MRYALAAAIVAAGAVVSAAGKDGATPFYWSLFVALILLWDWD